jgi:FkbM family methyltransferase
MSFKIVNLDSINEKYNLKVSGICHIGAWKAKEVNNYTRLFGETPVLFIEANPYLENDIKSMTENYDFIDYKIVAAGDKFSKQILHLHELNGQSSSLLKPLEHLSLYPWARFGQIIEVQEEPLDHILGDFSPNFLNIDVQGYELKVLKGAKEKLNSVDYIITEVNKSELYEKCALIEEIDEYLSEYGFERAELEWYGNTEPWGDAFYIKR